MRLLKILSIGLLAILTMTTVVKAQDVSVGYRAETTLPTGMVVSLVSSETREVEPANRGNVNNLLGVVVQGTDSLMTISSQESNVQVATDGISEVLVTDEGGPISEGDYLSVSSISGIAKVAGVGDSKILGTARGNFEDADISTITVEDSNGTRQVNVARIPLVIQIGANPNLREQASFLPDIIQGSADAVAGEAVGPTRIIIVLFVIAAGTLGSMVLLYGAVSSTIISIGRNPLSDGSVYGGLLRTIVVSVAILALTVIISYLVVAG
ncbi:MAG: hypothetical protein WDZ42_00725 [Candidatus Saccharimonadales bacterium]